MKSFCSDRWQQDCYMGQSWGGRCLHVQVSSNWTKFTTQYLFYEISSMWWLVYYYHLMIVLSWNFCHQINKSSRRTHFAKSQTSKNPPGLCIKFLSPIAQNDVIFYNSVFNSLIMKGLADQVVELMGVDLLNKSSEWYKINFYCFFKLKFCISASISLHAFPIGLSSLAKSMLLLLAKVTFY